MATKKRKPMAEINVVPYIDVMLVLLVIFMVTAPLLMQGVKVELPQASSAPLENKETEPLIVSIRTDGTFYLNMGKDQEAAKPLSEVTDMVGKVLTRNPQTPVLVWGDTKVEYGLVVHLMSELQKAGAPSVGLVTDPLDSYDELFRDSLIPIVVSFAIHGAVLGALLINWEPEAKKVKPIQPKFIEAKLVKLKDQTTKRAAAKKPKKIDLVAKRREKERLEREAEKKRQAQIKQEQEAKAKKEAEKLKQEEVEKQRARELEQEKKRKNKQRLQQEFEDALKAEEGMLMDELYAAEAQSYSSKIQERIQQNWNRPLCAYRYELYLAHTVGADRPWVVNVSIVQGSGNSAFDRSAIQAVKKVEVFPEIKEMSPALFEREFRQFKLNFNPQDLRL